MRNLLRAIKGAMVAAAMASYMAWWFETHPERVCPNCNSTVMRGTSPCPACGIGLRW